MCSPVPVGVWIFWFSYLRPSLNLVLQCYSESGFSTGSLSVSFSFSSSSSSSSSSFSPVCCPARSSSSSTSSRSCSSCSPCSDWTFLSLSNESSLNQNEWYNNIQRFPELRFIQNKILKDNFTYRNIIIWIYEIYISNENI